MLTIIALCVAFQTPTVVPPVNAAEIVPRTWLVVPALDAVGRRPFNANSVLARHLLAPDAAPPKKDDAITGDLGKEQHWTEVSAKDDGTLEGEPAWAYTAVESSDARVVVAELVGAGRLYVNGAGFAGDLYGYGFHGVPIALKAGRNDLFVTQVRGAFHLKLWTPNERIVVGDWDLTKPSMVVGEPATLKQVGVLVMNASLQPVAVQLGTGGAALSKDTVFQHGSNPGPNLPPLCVDKALLEMVMLTGAPKFTGRIVYPLVVDGREHSFEMEIVEKSTAHRVTFVSKVDGSVQECAVSPSLAATNNVVLTLHGAGVDDLGQVASYAAKKDFMLVAPTNRRPFGFDWQDWGRANAYEALAAAVAPRKLDDVAVYLTGHSMGGHGTWHLAANDPLRFVAIAPSAGWSSFDSYGGGKRDGELASFWRAADSSSDTLALATNLAPLPTYILHGDADDNVPVTEARLMEKTLREHGGAPTLFVQPGAGHWWDGAASPGADCVDWPGIFELFRATKPRPPSLAMDAITADVGVQSTVGWMELLQPMTYGQLLHVRSQLDDSTRDLVITTENVRTFRFRTVPAGWTTRVMHVDGTRFEMKMWDYAQSFSKAADGWHIAAPATRFAAQKSPEFSGPFKRAFDRGFVLVYGTQGDATEDAELLARARCDAETWWYRGNGSVRIVSDAEFLPRADSEWVFGMELDAFLPNVILYGNAETNGAWKKVFGADAVVDAHRGSMKIADHEWKGDDLAALFIAPRRDAHGNVTAIAAAFADSGLRGARLGYALSTFSSGIGYPDYTVFDSRVLTSADGGVLATGFLDVDWKPDGRGFLRTEKSKTEKR